MEQGSPKVAPEAGFPVTAKRDLLLFLFLGGVTPGGVQGLPLILFSDITPRRDWGTLCGRGGGALNPD